MNKDVLSGKWNELKGQVKSKWAKLTDDDMSLIGGKFDELVGRLQQRYGHSKDDAEKEVSTFIKTIPTEKPKPQA